ncbi:MAG: hypothetical protein GXO91_08855 [FCB group bacterium]|nr:hypothetical protein [FCB group bacterium]
MKIKLMLILMMLTFLLGQERSYLYTSGNPAESGGYLIAANDTLNFSMSLRLSTYALSGIEYFGFYLDLLSDTGNLTATLYSGSSTAPGEVISSADFSFTREDDRDRNMILIAPTDCLEIESAAYYWFSLQASDPQTLVRWQYSQNNNIPFCTSSDDCQTWNELTFGTPGAAFIWGSRLYQSSFDGDLNLDYSLDITDIVLLVAYILNQEELSPEQIGLADLYADGNIDILDIVAQVDIVLNGFPEHMPEFALEDLNDNSPSFGELVGPPNFQGDISCYYFGHAG